MYSLERMLFGTGLFLQGLITVLVIPPVAFVHMYYPELLPTPLELWLAYVVLGAHIIGFVIGLQAYKLLKTERRKAVKRFLITALVMLVLTMGGTIIQSTLFIIASMMILVKEQKAAHIES
ncbi:hypothetical protein BpOF4_17930 [Alkalihalophilus pseudofirmus OF4]|uniref:Uncharacterized protein n=1 Tax=Alkalihalophilus pseudofirmus (strain ATCC BAA-2126 / JCM 17055 / OF4) TaxID=398511 RepID=D3FRZ2_ALKPO|nr:hypothetical protein [Alkalihalophilus pseudofirmus]ADC51627.1 hypothetical protein BpOF4_17930 [Alkalihalophilus pseudofirmus OF4]